MRAWMWHSKLPGHLLIVIMRHGMQCTREQATQGNMNLLRTTHIGLVACTVSPNALAKQTRHFRQRTR